MRILRDGGAGPWRVAEMVPGFGADRSGAVRVGDVVESIDGRGLERVSEQDLVGLMCGPAGTTCTLKLLRNAQGEGGARAA